MLKRALLVTAAVVAAVVIWTAFTLPPARLVLPRTDDGTVSGVLHIHTNRSDGYASPKAVAAAAARAGLTFIVLTDHGDATRVPDPPAYVDGVLCLDGVEISTKGGHYVAIGLPAAPYPLGGEPRDVVEDVARLGGFGIAAHPDSPKHELRWDGWSAPFDGIEIVNPDTSWRVLAQSGLAAKLRLIAALGHYPLRPAEAIAGLLGDASTLLAQWERLTRERRVVAVAGTDAHGQMEPIPIPTYEASFNMLSVRVKPEVRLTGNAPADAAAILGGLRAGHVYTAVDGYAVQPSFEFSASNSAGRAEQGDELPAGGVITLTVRSNAPPTFTTTVWRGDQILETGRHESLVTVTGPEGPAVYRVEIHASDRPDEPLWIASNPIYVREPHAAPAHREPERQPPTMTKTVFDGRDRSLWRIEDGPGSRATLDGGPGSLHVRYQLGNNTAVDRVGLLASIPQFFDAYDRVTFSARADRPMRISIQLRTGRPGVPEERWQRSVYVDTTMRTQTVSFDDFRPANVTPHSTPPLADMSDLMFVVDATHAKPGAAGEFWVSGAALQR